VLGVVFLASGVAKLADVPSWTAQASGFGVPRAVGVAVPWVELVVGATVAARAVEPVPAVAALALLLVFTSVIAWNLRSGRRPPCACFGSWSNAPMSWRHVARNAAFIAIAVAVIAT
jgi:uncharacterized membrane protein YphA (DoxX/SURF4 family)